MENKIKTTKKGNRYIGLRTDTKNILWECKACKEFKKEKDIVHGTGEIICRECLMNDNYLKVVK